MGIRHEWASTVAGRAVNAHRWRDNPSTCFECAQACQVPIGFKSNEEGLAGGALARGHHSR
jgi:hypothetical protein